MQKREQDVLCCIKGDLLFECRVFIICLEQQAPIELQDSDRAAAVRRENDRNRISEQRYYIKDPGGEPEA